MNALRQSFVLATVTLGAALVACDHEPSGVTSPAKPATTRTAPATLPATAILNIDQKPVVFASPRLQVEREDDSTRLLLYSDSGSEDAGASFYFEIPVDADASPTDVVDWEQELPKVRTEDSLIGIDLGKTALEPRSLRITIRPSAPGCVHVELSGKFAPDQAAHTLSVNGSFEAGIRP